MLAFGSANPKTEETYESGVYTSYHGRTLAVVLPEGDSLEIQVQGETMKAIWKTEVN